MRNEAPSRPAYLCALTCDVPTLEFALAACIAAYSDHEAPTHLCSQCFDEIWQKRITAAAAKAQTGTAPRPEDYAQIYFEHPACSGGVDTIKLFTPYGLRDLLAGCAPEGFRPFSYPEVLETMVQSGFWFWPERLKALVRTLSVRLFWDWFKRGDYVWPIPDYADEDILGPGDDILRLCTLCQIDPFDLIASLSRCHTPQADDALAGPLNFSARDCTYVAADTSSDDKRYQHASRAIATTLAAREAQGFLTFATPQWLEQAFFRNCDTHPTLAKELSNFANYYSVNTITVFERANVPLLEAWPDLPNV